MLKGRTIEMVIIELAPLKGLELNGHEMLQIRSNVASSLAAKIRHHQKMKTNSFEWKKPSPQDVIKFSESLAVQPMLL